MQTFKHRAPYATPQYAWRAIFALVLALTAALTISNWQARSAHAIGWPSGGIVIPAGATATFSGTFYAACNQLTLGYQLNGGLRQPLPSFPGGCFAASYSPVTIGPFAAAQSLLISLQDLSCHYTYYSNGTSFDDTSLTATSVDHAQVSGANPYYVGFSDGGGYCVARTVSYNNFILPNAAVTLTINAPLDTTAPSLFMPAGGVTADATSPAGATVTYAVSASDPDNTASQLNISCAPASGSVFPIGTTTVQCTATDPAGNTSAGSFSVTVNGAATQVARLMVTVKSYQLLPSGVQTSFLSQLNAVQADISAGNVPQACLDLSDFISHAQDLTGTKLTVAQSDQLVAAATQVRAVLGC